MRSFEENKDLKWTLEPHGWTSTSPISHVKVSTSLSLSSLLHFSLTFSILFFSLLFCNIFSLITIIHPFPHLHHPLESPFLYFIFSSCFLFSLIHLSLLQKISSSLTFLITLNLAIQALISCITIIILTPFTYQYTFPQFSNPIFPILKVPNF